MAKNDYGSGKSSEKRIPDLFLCEYHTKKDDSI